MNLTVGFDPIIAQLGPFQLGWHGLFTALAVVIAVRLAAYLGKREGVSADVVYGVATYADPGPFRPVIPRHSCVWPDIFPRSERA